MGKRDYVTWQGEGTREKPYQLSSQEDLEELSESVRYGDDFAGCYFQVTDDIRLTCAQWPVIGDDYNRFQGQLDGNRHKISNVAVSGKRTDNGFFGCIGDKGEVINLEIQCTSVCPQDDKTLGAIAGANYGKISDCRAELQAQVQVLNEEETLYLGGIAGINQSGGSVGNCESTVEYTITGSGELRQQRILLSAGGIAGNNYSETGISNCTVSITCDSRTLPPDRLHAGGIAGSNMNGSVIENCTVTGTIKSAERVYGLAGKNCGEIKGCTNRATLEVHVATAGGAVYGLLDDETGISRENSMAGGVVVHLEKKNAKVKITDGCELQVYSVYTE